VTWTAVLAVSGGAYLFKLVGVMAGNRFARALEPVAGLIPAALFSAIIAIMTVADVTTMAFDARLVGVGLAVVAVRRRAPFVVVVLVAMVATALVRLLG
jgi:hypothetical protein|tara:strand:- start:3244 stop:3540 length:297 start_codon:yes stop_codon:yes gene_type:complete